MIGWIRRLRLPARLRRWSDTVRAIFHGWSWPYWKRLFGRLFLPRPKPDRRIIPSLETLEAIEAPDNLLALTAPLGAAAIVHTAESSSQTPDVKGSSDSAGASMRSPTVEDEEWADRIFSETTAPDDSFSVDDDYSLAAADQWVPSGDDAEPKHTANDPTLDAVMAADKALVDPVFNPAPNAADGPHHAGPPMGNGINGTSPNFAGAYTGAGQGPGGASTPFAGGGGGAGGWGAGPGVTNANQFSSANLNMAGSPMTNTPMAVAVSPPAAVPTPSVPPTTSLVAASSTPSLPAIGMLPGVMPTVGGTAGHSTSNGSNSNSPGVLLLPEDSGNPSGEQIYATPGTYTWTDPAGVTSVNIQLWGGGGGGGAGGSTIATTGSVHHVYGGGGGGGGGQYLFVGAVSVTPGTNYTVVVGRGGVSGEFGYVSSFNGTYGASGGDHGFRGGISLGGLGGGDGSGNGGAGATGTSSSGTYAGGGGGGGGGTTPGSNGGDAIGTTEGSGGAGGTGSGAGGGGGSSGFQPSNGQSPGGGGGGGGYINGIAQAGANGGDGEVIISWATLPPVANNDSYSLPHDTTLSVPAPGVLANDTDPNNLPLSAVLVSNASHGSVNLNSDGSFTYTPNAGYTGSDSFTYYATDGTANSNNATVTLSVTDSGTITTQADSYSIPHDQTLSADASTGVLANDSDSDGDALTASLASQASHGNVTLAPDGSFTYTPNAGYVGTDSFQYTASDGVQTSSPTTVSISVTDNAPVAVNHSYGIPENTTANVTAASGLLQGATDADGDPLTASLASNASHGTVTVNADGSFSYTPNTNYTGSDSFTYSVSDGALTATATVTLNVHAGNTAPTANPDSYSVLHDQELDVPASTGVLANDSDAENDPMTASVVNGPSEGTLTLNADGSFTYTPNTGFTGTDSFTYTASDGNLTSSPATVTISVTDPNAPVAVDDSYSVERNNEFDADANFGVLANDTDADGDTLTASLVSGPSNGTLTLNSDGSFSYTPNTGFTGTDSFTYQASDGVLTSNTATVTLTVTASPPGAADQTLDVLQNTALNALPGTLLLNGSNPDNMSLTAQDVTQPQDGTVMVNPDGSFVYTPTSGFTGTDSFTYDLSDGALTSDPATVTINVKPTNTAPTAADLSYSVDENTSLSTDSDSGVLSGASDADSDPLTAVLVSGPSNGTLTFNLDGSFTYTPNTNFSGTDSFQYEVFDGTTYSSAATVTLTVNEDVPTANPDSYSVLSSGPTPTGSVLDNDTDPDGTPLTAVLQSQPSYGSLTFNSDGTFTYTPGSNFTGSDSFTYEAYNGLNYSTPATVTLTSGPVASAQEYGVTHDQTLTVDATDGLLTGASDANSDTLTAALASGPSDGTVTVNSDGSFTYTPNTHFLGTDSFTYTVSDGTNTSQPATVTIDVTNAVPQAYPQDWDTPEGTALVVNAASGVLASSSDDDGDTLTAQVASGPSNGSLTLGSGGNFTYTPNAGFFGTDSFTYEVSDGVSTSDPATVTITVDETIPENQPGSVPSAVAVADFNNDGNPDVAEADQGLNTVSVYLDDSNGDVATTPVSTITVGNAPVALVAGDFGNGQQDLAVVNSGDNTVSILLGNGDGTFTTSQVIGVGTDPVSIVAGNFLGDGVLDLAVANKGSNTITFLLNNGSGTFTVYSTITVGNAPDAVAAGDLNGDGKDDLVVANSGDNDVSVLLSNGNGTFTASVSYTVGTAPSSVVLAELDQDGNLDVAVANSGSNNVSVLLGNGDGTFQAATNYAVGSDPVSIMAGNFDGNGYMDLSVANKGDNTLSSLYNYGDGQFFAGELSSAVSDPVFIATGDFNHDGLTDQAIALGDPKVEVKIGTVNQDAKFFGIAAAYSPDGKVLVYAERTLDGEHDIIKMWNIQNLNKPVSHGILTVSGGHIRTIAYSQDTTQKAQWLAIAIFGRGAPQEIEIVDLTDTANPKVLMELPVPDKTTPMSVAFSNDDVYLAAGLSNGSAAVWKLSQGQLDFCTFSEAYAAGVSAVSRTSRKAFGNFAKATS